MKQHELRQAILDDVLLARDEPQILQIDVFWNTYYPDYVVPDATGQRPYISRDDAYRTYRQLYRLAWGDSR